MKRRCYDQKDKSFINYGLKGVIVCDRWIDNFDAFIEDMGEPEPFMTLERINGANLYSPDNCKWASFTEQANNKCNNQFIEFDGVKLSINQWAKKISILPSTLHKRIFKYKIPLEKALQPERINAWRHGTRAAYEKHKCKCNLCKEAHNKRFRDIRLKKRKLNE